MYNFLSQGPGTLVNTSATLTLGFGAGQTAPPMVLVQNLTASGTVTLPKINQVPPSPPATPGTTPGVSDGDALIIKNIAAFTTTLTPASGDTCDVALIGIVGDTWLVADAGNSKWRAVVPGVGSGSQVTSSAGNVTLSTSTRYFVHITTAGTITIPATFNALIGQPFTIINDTSGSDTLTPASGTINTTASYTLTTLNSATFISDGTNFQKVSG
jgi:hypothetical protein